MPRWRRRAPFQVRRSRGYPEISREGRIAGLVTAGCLLVAGVAFPIASWDELTCRSEGCARQAGVGGLVWLGSLFALAFALATVRWIGRRPVDENGSSGWTWGLAVLSTAGAWLLVTRIPSLSCPVGYHLDVGFRLCIQGADRFDAADRVWLKSLLWAGSALLGATAIRWPRSMPWSAVAAALAWFAGTGWILHDTVGRFVR